MRPRWVIALACLAVLGGDRTLAAARSDQVDKKDRVQARRDAIDEMAHEALDGLIASNDSAREAYQRSVAHAVFDSFKFALLLSGGGGVGVAVDHATGRRTYMKMGTGGVGLGLGGQSFQVVFLFENQKTFERFVESGWHADLSANAVAGTSGKNAPATFTDGVAVYQITNKGLMAQADVAGTKYWKYKKLNR